MWFIIYFRKKTQATPERLKNINKYSKTKFKAKKYLKTHHQITF